jgi:succinate dehydrogenase flavin-adding protein (antitoxin of CptAB toxin-antitoxin module)
MRIEDLTDEQKVRFRQFHAAHSNYLLNYLANHEHSASALLMAYAETIKQIPLSIEEYKLFRETRALWESPEGLDDTIA